MRIIYHVKVKLELSPNYMNQIGIFKSIDRNLNKVPTLRFKLKRLSSKSKVPHVQIPFKPHEPG